MKNRTFSISNGGLLEMSVSEFLDVVLKTEELKKEKRTSYKAFEDTYNLFQRQFHDYCRDALNRDKKNELIFGKPYKTGFRE